MLALHARVPLVLSFALSFAFLTGCGGGSSSDSEESTSDDPVMDLELTTHSQFGQVELSLNRDSDVDILYSSDPECDWDNPGTCENYDMLPGVSESASLDGEALALNRNYYFVAQAEGERSSIQAGAAWAPGVNGTVYDAAVTDGRLYVGGDFTHTAAPTHHGLITRTSDDQLAGALQRVNGDVEAVASDGEGGWYIGGEFTQIAGEARDHLARIQPSGALDPDWHPSVDDTVYALVRHEDTIIAGGNFQAAGNTTRDHVAAFDADTGELKSWNSNATDGTVYALLLHRNTLYAGGSFGQASSEDMENMAALGPETGLLREGWQNPRIDGSVYALAPHDDWVFAGGSFGEAGEAEERRRRIAAVEADSGAIPHWSAQAADGTVYALATVGDVLYAGGRFSEAGGHEREALAAYVPDTGFVKPWNPGANDDVNVLLDASDQLIAGGDFDLVDGEFRSRLASFEHPTGDLKEWTPGTTDEVLAMAASDQKVYVGGEFLGSASEVRPHLAAFDVQSGKLLPWSPQVNDTVKGLATDGDAVYVGGDFEQAEDEDREQIAAFSASGGELLSWDPGTPSFTEQFRTLKVSGDLVLAGWHNSHWDSPRAINAYETTAIGDSERWDVEISGGTAQTVRAIALHDEALYIGGDFEEIDDEPIDNLARLNLDPTNPNADPSVDTGWDASVSSSVYSLSATSDKVYTGAGHDLTAYKADDGDATSWTPGSNHRVLAMVHTEDRVYVGGRFSEIDTTERERLAALDADNGQVVSDWNPGANARVHTLAHDGEIVFVGGAFTSIVKPALHIMALDENGEPAW